MNMPSANRPDTIEREVWPALKAELAGREILVITGPRQVGKTTTLKWLLDQVPDNKLYLDLTLVSTQRLFESGDYDAVANALKGFGLDLERRAVVAVDEIQYSRDFPRAVKYLYDHYGIKFILTGSSAFYLKNHFSESLSARKLIFELLPLSFREFLAIKGVNYIPPKVDFAGVSDARFDAFAYGTLSAYYDEYIEFGGFPVVALSGTTERKRRMLDVIYSSYINMDVTQLADFKSISDLKKLVSLLAVRVGTRLNIDELSKTLGVSRPTIMNHIAFLEQTYLIRMLPAFSKSPAVRERLPKKVYFVDTGIANTNAALSGGAQFENTLCHQLRPYGTVAFSNQGGEIDFVLSCAGKTVALEAKETPVEKHLAETARRAARIDADAFAVIGRAPSATLNTCVWGGNV
ncbi:MAG: ATP-binding protein [Methylobacteriaceae bacterium]|nr:ATP-binding protein [Methylobacteriaceae bacterium]